MFRYQMAIGCAEELHVHEVQALLHELELGCCYNSAVKIWLISAQSCSETSFSGHGKRNRIILILPCYLYKCSAYNARRISIYHVIHTCRISKIMSTYASNGIQLRCVYIYSCCTAEYAFGRINDARWINKRIWDHQQLGLLNSKKWRWLECKETRK